MACVLSVAGLDQRAYGVHALVGRLPAAGGYQRCAAGLDQLQVRCVALAPLDGVALLRIGLLQQAAKVAPGHRGQCGQDLDHFGFTRCPELPIGRDTAYHQERKSAHHAK